jgi:hypothetical protein
MLKTYWCSFNISIIHNQRRITDSILIIYQWVELFRMISQIYS